MKGNKNLEGELNKGNSYNSMFKPVRKVDNQETFDPLTKIFKTEEGHEDWNEMQRSLIEQMLFENYLANPKEE